MNNFVLIKQLPLKFNILKKKSQSIIYFKLLTIVITILSCAVSSWGQTIRTVGTGGNYSSLRLACQAITSGTLTGNIELQIKSSIIETNSIIIPASGTGSASYSSVKIYPIGSGYTISGTIAGPLISLNSADNITFDGRVNQTGSTEDLTISNLSTGNETTNCTFRFINSAENNSVKYCTVKGASLSVTGGIILFSTSTSGNGNDNNTIDNCNITNAGGNRPLNAILSSANSTALNSTCTISNNNIYDFFNASTNSFGINISQFSSGWSITGNSFYETATFTPSQSRIYTCLYIGYSSGNNFTVTGNYIGGKATQCEGTAWTVNTSTYGFEFHGIEIMLGTTPASNFQNNTITNISFTSRDTQFYGIFISSGDLNIGTTSGNTIGSSTGTGSITLTSSLNTSTSYGIYNNNSAGTSTLQNNIIGSITTIGTADYSHSFTAIKNVSAQTTIISNNIIGSTATANSIQASYSTTSTNAQNVYGINSTGSGTTTISGNTISNMHNASLYTTSGQISGIFTSAGVNTISNNIVRNLSSTNPNTNATTTASVVGILQTSTADNQTISGNSIYSLSNTNTGNVVVSVIGIYYSGPTTGTNSISKTFINNLTLSSGSATAKIFGIRIGSGATTYSNNVINIGTGITSSYLIYGLYETGAASNNNYVYFNTVYLNGSPASGSANTYAFWSNANTNTRNFRNNIFYNARSNNGASGKHFAAYFNYANNASLTLSNNDYFVDGTGGVLGYSNGADKTALPIVATKDANSSIVNPNFIKVISPPSYYLNSAIETGGVTGTGILTDYEGTTRRSGASPNTPSMGAFESPLATIPVAPIAVNNSRCGTGSVSISATPGSAQTIDWYNVSSGGTVLANGSGTTTFNTPGISSTTSYYAEARNITTGATSSTRTEVTATINNAPSEPGEITGVTSVCSGQEGVTYSINPVDGATGYTWSVPSDASITDGTGTTDITVTFGSTSGDISVSADNSCSSIAVSTLITVNALPTPTFTSEPGASACADIDVTYATETDNTDYVWSITGTLNTDYTITSGGTVTDYSVTIKWLTAGNKIVTVNYSDANGCPSATPASSIETIVNVAPLPPFTEEPGASTCIDTDVTYTTESDNTNYLWSVPGTLDIDYTITSGGTASDNTLIVKWLTTGSKTVTVNYTDANGCSAATPSSSTATTVNSAPSQPGTITGLTTVSSGQTGVTYSISSVSGATGYTWSVPSGASITAGSGTTAITVTFGSVSGNVSVTADNSCGSSTARNLAITVNGCSSPAQPGTITGLTTVSSGQTGVTYSISSVSGATGYTWSVPSGASITAGTGTTNITVTFGS